MITVELLNQWINSATAGILLVVIAGLLFAIYNKLDKQSKARSR